MQTSRALFLLVCVASVAAGIAAWSSLELAASLLAVALLALAGWLVVQLRGLRDEVRAGARAARRSGKSAGQAQARALQELTDLVTGTLVPRLDRLQEGQDAARVVGDKHAARLVQRLGAQRDALQRMPSTVVELERAYDRLVPDLGSMPMLGGWALTPGTLLGLLELVEDPSCRTVLECGSGTSTVWFAAALERRGGEGRIVSLDSDPVFAQQTRDQLQERGLAHRALVIDAPLGDVAAGGRPARPWYALDALPQDLEVDVLVVDGPIGFSAPEARYPAFPLLAHLLRAGGTVVLDDATRPDEQRILQAWTSETHAGRRLREVRQVDRAVLLEVERD